MKCSKCDKEVKYHHSGLCGICAGWKPVAAPVNRTPSSYVPPSGVRRERGESGLFIPVGRTEADYERIEKAARERDAALTYDQYGNVVEEEL